MKNEYANITFSNSQQHFHETTTGITPESYYGNLSKAVVDEISKGIFDNCKSGLEIVNKVPADKKFFASVSDS